ncbi:alpha/beta-Hydrolases superfamily protein [Euphorbia peplus]|nr:alpha/beta-Hydrolases superfamily protein [Euphorbia peplus]
MAAISYDPRLHHQRSKANHGVIVEEIEGLVKLYRDGRVERPPSVPNVHCSPASNNLVTAKDVIIDEFTNLWTRIYVPSSSSGKLPLVLYFHGGGFCVGSAAWICYHDFLSNLSAKTSSIIMSVNYHLAPENRLPCAYDDGIKAIMWVKQLVNYASLGEHKWWLSRCNLSQFFLSGDSAGANIAYNVATRLAFNVKPLNLKGIILIQPFFGGETRTSSEKYTSQPVNSALTISASDSYWRLSLPVGANRDHPYCNPLNGVTNLQLPNVMVCISELDILKDRNLEFCSALAFGGTRVERVIYKGVRHAFQILDNSSFSQIRIQEMMSHLRTFINQ